MSDELGKKQEELKKLEQELKHGGLSRRNFLNRLSAIGVGFGAAAALGVKGADAASPADGGVTVASSNPAVDNILAESRATEEEGDPLQHMAQYGRWYRRGYRRWYGRYRRWYSRYRRWYRRYARWYRRW
jgi:hypothetical protein